MPLPDAFTQALAERFGKRFSTAEAVRAHHGHDESHFPDALPDGVVWPHSTAEVVEVVKLCHAHRVPVIPFGVGSSLEGHILATNGGISIDLSEMNQIVTIHDEDMDAVVQPGVTRKTLNAALHGTGLFFPIDPGADASLGGMASTRASGTNAVRYGTMRENVLGLEVVLADGRVIRTGGRARKSSAGYDLTRLFVGSEGTLGIITELTVRLHPLPEAISSATCSFPDVASAVQTVIQTIQLGVPVARIELLDDVQVRAINHYSKFSYPELSTLFFEFHGTAAGVAEQAEIVGWLAEANGGQGFKWTTDEGERRALWQARHDAYYAALSLKPGCKGWATDVCVPISRLAECVLETKRDIEASNVMAPIVGHVGEGNFHLVYLLDPDDREDWKRAEALNERMVMRALAMGGTCTGEHGIGMGKMDFLVAEQGEAISLMRQIKKALDPENILNPGKILRV